MKTTKITFHYLQFVALMFLMLGQSQRASAQPEIPLFSQADGGSQWTSIRTEQLDSEVVVRELGRAYPETGPVGTSQAGLRPVATPTQAQSLAEEFLTKHSGLITQPLGLAGSPTNGLSLKEIISVTNKSEFTSRGTEHTVVYTQHQKGIPVFESSMTVSITQHGEVWSVINKLAKVNLDIPTPRLTSVDALSHARLVLGDPAVIPEAEASLYIIAPAHLAWRLNFLKPHFKEMMIDAVSGDVLLQRKNIRD